MSESRQEGIAIIGMAGRFPGADSVEEFWENLTAGRESITFFADEELAASGLDVAALKRAGNYVPARGVLKDADCFDAAFFGIHQKEAEVMDPQQRVFLEGCWEALERAGYAPGQIDHSVGVYAGATFNTYYLHALHHRRDLVELAGQQQVMLGNEKDYIATRVAYKLNLKGPAVSLNTACSSSLVAVCQACQALLTYQCDMALAGGISVTVPQKRGYYYQEGNINSPDGHTRTFDEKAEGTVFSSGMGIVVLKRLEEALEDGDQIYAVIKAATLNNDGSQRVSFVAPGVDGQADVIALAHALAGINPETITYVEAHGTATPMGDPIELAALTKAFRARTQRKQFCAIGSVKSNIGHLDAASGVAGLIKTALALRHGLLPASLHFKKPNPRLELENSPFIVCETTQPWNSGDVPRRAGVSSFGLGGTNAHVVLEEAPEIPPSDPSRPWQLLPLSAKTPLALEAATRNLTAWFKERPRMSLADAAFTLQVGRSEFAHRRFAVSRDPQDAAKVLEAQGPKRVFAGERRTQEPPVVFMFPGQGVQYASMGAELYRTEPVFRAVVDQCSELLEPVLGLDLRHSLYPAKGQESASQELLAQTRVTQPALFVTEYALARLWMSWGVRPAAMIGHSVGEYVAACLAGVLHLEQAVLLVAQRAHLVQGLPRGAMLAVRLCEKEVASLLDGQLSIAAVNSPNLCVASGPYAAVAALEKVLESKGVASRRLHTSHAFHSAMMDPVIEPFRDLLRKNPFNSPQVRYISNVTGKWVTAEESTSPDYWARHLRQCVRFADGLGELTKDPENILLEVGPGQTLATLARQHPNRSTKQLVVSSLQNKDEEARSLLETLGHLWTTGVRIDWGGFYSSERRQRVVLPTYPFDKKRYWPEPHAAFPALAPTATLAVSPSSPAPESNLQCTTERESPAFQYQTVSRKHYLVALVRSQLQDLSGTRLESFGAETSFLEVGFDSLLLMQAAQLLQRKFGVKVTFRKLIEDLPTLETVASFLDSQLPPDAFQPAPAALKLSTALTPAAAAGSGPLSASAESASAFVEEKMLPALLPASLPDKTSQFVPATMSPQLLTLEEAVQAEIENRTKELAAMMSGRDGSDNHPVERFIKQQLEMMVEQIQQLRQAHSNGGSWRETASTSMEVAAFLRPPMGITQSERVEIQKERESPPGARQAYSSSSAAIEFPLSEAVTSDIGEYRKVPLTEAQREIWVATQMGPAASAAYHLSWTIHCHGGFDLTAMLQAIEAVVNRHEALRTTFSPNGDYQQFSPSLRVKVPFLDLSELERSRRDAELDSLLTEEGQRSFDLVTGPLFSFRIIRMEENHHLLVFTVHHLVCDGRSYDIVMRQLSSLYSSYVRGEKSRLVWPMQFSEYVRWEQEEKQRPEAVATEQFWLNQFTGSLPVLDLPGDHPRPPVRSYKGAHQERTISKVVSDKIKGTAANNGCTLFAILFAAFEVLLHRWSGQEDLIVGIPTSGQNLVGSNDLIGHCANLLPIRSRLGCRQPFVDFLKSVRRTLLDASEHQRYTFGTLIQSLFLPRDPSRSPLVQVTFNLDPPIGELDSEALKFRITANPRSHLNFDLEFNIVEEDGELRVECDYNSDLFGASTIQRLLGSYRTLLDSIAAGPLQTVGALPLLAEDERKQLILDWNNTRLDSPRNETVVQLFEAQVERVPQVLAATSGSDHLTYEKLNRRANQVAHYLQKLRVTPGALVGICMKRSLDMMVALLGILKAGCAYVPLDPSYPKQRLEFMLEDAQLSVMLTQQNLLEGLPGWASPSVCLDTQWQEISRESEQNPAKRIDSDDLAYVIYTSGSTGQPKGVQVPHRALTNCLTSMRQEPGLTENDRLLAVTTLSFDIAALELFLPLCVGARLILASSEIAADGVQLLAALEQFRVTVMQATPATWQLLIEAGWQGKSDLKILCGGEALSRALAGKLLEMGAAVWNLYGPTETTIWSLRQRVNAIDDRAVPIGRPIANTQVYVLDQNQQLVPVGVPGELYIGGSGLARGYLNRRELTAQKFIKDPFNPEADSRLYRSGDLARYRTDGTIEFLGRIDHQVKLRGFRIELGEIESVLTRHPDVTQAVVMVREDVPGVQRLVAYIVGHDGHSCEVGDLRSFVGKMLPDYMLPSVYMFLDALPLTPNGKVERRELPVPDSSQSIHRGRYKAPRSPLEEMLAGIMAEILNTPQVGVEDDFFELGGHSLLATQVIARIRSKLRVDLPLRALFESRTVERLSQAVITLDTSGQAVKIARILKQIEEMSLGDVKSTLREKIEQEKTRVQ